MDSGTFSGSAFDSGAGLTACEILGDGFVRTGNRRIPVEAFVLELRQVTRDMTADELLRYAVKISFASGITETDGAAAQNMAECREFLIAQLYIMGVGQAGT